MITEEHKLEIGRLIVLEQDGLGGWKNAANRLGVNQVTIRYNMQEREKWPNVSEKMWLKVAKKLGYKITESAWQMVETINTQVMCELLDRAQNEQLFTMVSFRAGQGKTAGCEIYRMHHDAVFYIRVKNDWSHKRFVQELAAMLGVKIDGLNIADMVDHIVGFLRQKAIRTRPLLIIDEAGELKPASLLLMKTFYNELFDQIGLVMISDGYLKRKIQQGVRRNTRGFDEIESRFGRSYMELVGIFEQDVIAICNANGLTDPEAQKRAWNRMQPTREVINGAYEWVSKQDLRVLIQAIKHERAGAKSRPMPTDLGDSDQRQQAA